MVDYAKVLRCVQYIVPRIQAGQDIRASVHGGLLNGSDQDSEQQYKTPSINADDDKMAPLL